MELPPRVSPVQVNPELGVSGERPQPKVQIGAAFSRKAVPAVHLSHEPSPIWKVDGSTGANCRPAADVSPRRTWTDSHRSRLERLQEMESQKRTHVGTIILVERRASPHIRHRE